MRGVRITMAVACLALGWSVTGCGGDDTTTVVRGADDVQVMSPEEVAAVRLPVLTTVAPAEPVGAGSTVAGVSEGTGEAAGDTVPQNQDDRAPELRLFEAFGEFRGCLQDKGFNIEGNLLDPNNPAYQQPGYLDAVQTCAARTDIVSVLQEVQATRASLTPEEVEQRNVVFKELQTCLEGKGWTVESRTSEIGLLEPSVFQNADGALDERDINQCLSEQNLGG